MKLVALIALMFLAHVGDMWTTAHALNLGCGELNPLYHYVGYWGLGAVKFVVLGFIAVFCVTKKRNDILYLGVGGGIVPSLWNILNFPHC